MEDAPLPKIGIMVGTKGRGSNMAALIRACQNGQVPGEISVVISSAADTTAAEVATSFGMRAETVLPGENYGGRLLEALDGCTWLCLAGFLRMLPAEVLAQFPDRVLNIHPSLLPKFGGQGMYGLKVHVAVLEANETESGCTVHLVNEKYDDGAIVLQKRCPVLPGDTAETLAARVLELEHQAYPEALRKVMCD